jgi:hypothetical protein
MDHDVAGYSEPSFRTPEPTSLEDETTVIVPRTGPHSSPRPLPRKHTPEGVPLRMQGSSVVAMVPRKRMNDTPAPLPPRKTPPPLLSSMAVASQTTRAEQAAHAAQVMKAALAAQAARASNAAPSARVARSARVAGAASATAAAPRHERGRITRRPDRRWSSRTLAILGAGMGTGIAMILGVGLLGMVAVLAPPSNNVVTNPAASSLSSAPGWVDVVVAVGTTIVTGEPAVDRLPPVAAVAAAPKASVFVAPAPDPTPEAKETRERVFTSVAPSRAPSPVRPPASAGRVPSKKAGAAPPARTARAVPASAPAAPVASAVVPAKATGAESLSSLSAGRAPRLAAEGSSDEVAVASAEIDPWAEPLLAPEPEGVPAGEVEVWSPQADVAAPVAAPQAMASAQPEVDLLAGDDGLGEATEWKLEKATLVDLGGTAASNEEGLADVASLDTRVVRISVSGGPAAVAIDGRSVGKAPAVIEVAPGVHTVTLSVEGKDTTFELQARSDPDAWCFEARGRSFAAVTCGL